MATRMLRQTLMAFFIVGYTGVHADTSLSSCPANSYSWTGSDGAQFQICPGTDIQVPSSNIVNGIKSASACAQLCQTTAGCKQAVYLSQNQICHIKGNPTNAVWAVNSVYDAIHYVATLADGSPITSCPEQTTTVQNADGSQSIICPMSDYQVPSDHIIGYGIADTNACASMCAQTSGCARAVFDRNNTVCHLKGSPATPNWALSLNQFDSVVIVRGQAVSTTVQPTPTTMTTIGKKTTATTSKATATTAPTQAIPLSACPSKAWTYTFGDGSLYEACPGSSYQGATLANQSNVLSTWSCMQACKNYKGCSKSVYDNTTLTCALKDNTATLISSASFDTARFVNQTAYMAPPYAGLGAWAAPVVMPVIPVAAYVVPEQPVSNRVLMFSSWGANDFSQAVGVTQFADFNWKTGAVSGRTVANTNHDMFCPGISMLQDGRIVITGGDSAEVTSLYDPSSNSFVRGPDMQIPRGYQSSTITSLGQVFTVGGSFTGGIGGKTGEVYDPKTNSWAVLPNANVTPILTTDHEGAWRTDNHAWLYGWKNGSVFQAGPSKVQHWYDTNGAGNVVTASTRDPNHDAMCGVNVMYDAVAGKIMSTGGSQDYTDSPAFTTTHITTIGTPYKPSVVEQVADMANPRAFANGVVLPDGTVLVTGGQKRALVFTDIDSILTPELFDPVKKTWKSLAAEAIPRNYHSVSLLLADGTVFSGGGGMCPQGYQVTDAWCDRVKDHDDAQIFSPPYLFKADGSAAPRPVISGVKSNSDTSGNTVKVGGSLTIGMGDASTTTFSFVRMGSSTHSINTDQRRIPLTSLTKTSTGYSVKLPTDAGIMLPGYYYLFALNSAGTPSIARTIQVTL